jgi:hypothetical protein
MAASERPESERGALTHTIKVRNELGG